MQAIGLAFEMGVESGIPTPRGVSPTLLNVGGHDPAAKGCDGRTNEVFKFW
jgi:hypothetical protein